MEGVSKTHLSLTHESVVTRKSSGLETQVLGPALLLTCCVTLREPIPLSGLRVPIFKSWQASLSPPSTVVAVTATIPKHAYGAGV